MARARHRFVAALIPGLIVDDGGMRYIFEPAGARAQRLRIDVGSGHYVLTRIDP